jgi:hypothetical protein
MAAANRAGSGQEATDKMRRLLARYAASNLDRLKENPDFIEILYGGGDFVLDLFMAVREGPEIYQHELKVGGNDWVSS